MRRGKTKTRVRELISTVTGDLTEQDVANAMELVEDNEWGIAFDLVCTQLYEYEKTVPEAVFHEIVKLGRTMNLDESLWEGLDGSSAG